jgi:predicted RNA-binding Zn-ribbon protein involved in translation (DUF1610 family)
VSKYTAVCTNAQCPVNIAFECDELPAFCPRCGNGVIDHCPHCDREIENPGNYSCSMCGQRLRFDPDPKTGIAEVIIQR